MTRRPVVPATAVTLLDAASPYGPAADGPDLVFARDLPPDLMPALRVLHTGVRAVLTGRRWFGLDAAGRGTGPGRDGALNPTAPIPHGTALLGVEGGGPWDRVDPAAALALPHLFAPPAGRPEPAGASPGRRSVTRPDRDPAAGRAELAIALNHPQPPSRAAARRVKIPTAPVPESTRWPA